MSISPMVLAGTSEIGEVRPRLIRRLVSFRLRILACAALLSLCGSSFADNLQSLAVEFARAAYDTIKGGNYTQDHLEEIWEAVFHGRPLLPATDAQIDQLIDDMVVELKLIAKKKGETLTQNEIDTAKAKTRAMLIARRDRYGGI